MKQKLITILKRNCKFDLSNCSFEYISDKYSNCVNALLNGSVVAWIIKENKSLTINYRSEK